MCLVGLALNHFEGFPVVLVANRDEFHARPTAPLHAWESEPVIYAGRDLQAGGTWLGVSEQGRIAVLTNLRGHPVPAEPAPSRGELVTGFLSSDLLAEEWVNQLSKTAHAYAGFNLLLSDDSRSFHLFSNAGDRTILTTGVHAISNGRMDEPWPKTSGLRESLAGVCGPLDPATLCRVMDDARVPPDPLLPDTGVGIEFERRLAPRLIVGDDYGTRCTSVLLVDTEGTITLTEFTRSRSGVIASSVTTATGG